MSAAWLLKPLPMGAITASSIAIGDPIYLGNDYAGVIWASDMGTSAFVTVDLQADTAIDTVLLFGVEGAPADAQLTIRAATEAQGSAFGGGDYWESDVQNLYAGDVRLPNGRGIALADIAPPTPVRYVRLIFSDLGGSYIQAARVAIGARFVPLHNFGYDPAFGVLDTGEAKWSNRGVLLRRRSVKLRRLSVTFGSATKTEVESVVQPLLQDVGNTDPIAFITEPDADPQRENRIYFGPLPGDLSNVWRTPQQWEWKSVVESIF